MPTKIKNMKAIDIFCSSPTFTSICSKPTHHRLPDPYKKTVSNNNSKLLAPCIAELPFTPRPKASTPRRKSSADISEFRDNSYKKRESSRRSTSSRYLLSDIDSQFSDSLSEPEGTSKSEYHTLKKCMALVPSTPVVRSNERELTRVRSLVVTEKENANNNNNNNNNKRNIIIKSNYEKTEKEGTNYDNYGQIIARQKIMGIHKIDSSPRDQVVVLRVSLHCKGCEGKLRKYLSKMEGVKTFSIDLETKKVTVVGNITPLGLLTSISKVKYAQLWPYSGSSSSGSSTSSSNSSTSETNY